MMKDLTDPRWIKLKGLLFLLLGIVAALLLVAEQPTLKVGLLLALTIWCFCRAYYFAFYVIERYIDPSFRFSGLWSCARYLMTRRGDGKLERSSDVGRLPNQVQSPRQERQRD